MIDTLISELEQRQKRYSRKEKDEFLEFLKNRLTSLGFHHELIKSDYPVSKHLMTSDHKDEEIILLAHYDTSTTLPVWLEGLFRLTGHTRNTLIILVILLICQLVQLTDNEMIIGIFRYGLIASVLIPVLMLPNKHTMNDNTSGVLALLLLAEKFSKNETLKNKVKLVFTDNEEKGLIGSFLLKRIWKKKRYNYSSKKIISIDSIGRGNNMIISYNFNDTLARDITNFLNRKEVRAKSINMHVFPFSDAYNFSKNGAVNINMMDKALIPGGYCIRNIHSRRDKSISKRNILQVVSSVEEYIKTSVN